jgi:hypothetical protein
MPEAVVQAVTMSSAWLGQALFLTVLTGLFVRRRYRVCYSFVLYLLVVLGADLLLLLGPKKIESDGILMSLLGAKGFYSRTFWFIKELTINVLRFGIALELAYRTFRSFPGARSTARGVLLLLISITLFSVLAVTPQVSAVNSDDRIEQVVGRLQPRVLNGTVWLLTGIAAVVLWYRLPVDRFHKAILIGLVPFLLIFTIGLNAIETNSWSRGTVDSVNHVHALAYLLLLAYWAWAAWAPVRSPVQPPGPLPALERQAG